MIDRQKDIKREREVEENDTDRQIEKKEINGYYSLIDKTFVNRCLTFLCPTRVGAIWVSLLQVYKYICMQIDR